MKMATKMKVLPKDLKKAQGKTMTFNLSLKVKVDCGRLQAPVNLWTADDPIPEVVLPTNRDIVAMVKEALKEYANSVEDCFFGPDPDCRGGYEGGAWIANSRPSVSVWCDGDEKEIK
jgi:hypothetical protein